MSPKKGVAIFLVLTVLQAALYFSGLLMGLVFLPYIGGLIWLMFMPGDIIFSFLSGSTTGLMNMYPYLGIFPLLFNSLLYTALLALLFRIATSIRRVSR